jgi:hypothetical protein
MPNWLPILLAILSHGVAGHNDQIARRDFARLIQVVRQIEAVIEQVAVVESRDSLPTHRCLVAARLIFDRNEAGYFHLEVSRDFARDGPILV